MRALPIKWVPNLLSVGRIALTPLLFTDRPPVFSVCYLLCGLTDILDGVVVRKYHAQTALGAKLDSLGDAIFWLVVIVQLFTRSRIPDTLWAPAGMALVAGVRLANLIITRAKFHQWAMLHTAANKITGVALFFLCYAALAFNAARWYVWTPVFGLALLAAVEETVILWRSTRYEPNPKGFFTGAK